MVSACLAGVACRHDGKPLEDIPGWLLDLVKTGQAVLVCPEQLGGLPSPRPQSEIQGGSGADVVDGKAKVVNENGDDVTLQFTLGAQKALQLALASGAQSAILKARSPSCGCAEIHDGTFSGNVKDGEGVMTALFRKAGINCIDEGMFREDW